MPFDIPPAPSSSLSSLAAALPRMADLPNVSRQAPNITSAITMALQSQKGVATAMPTVSVPVYVVGLDSIIAGRGLGTMTPTLWTHLLPTEAGSQSTVAADMTVEGAKFAALTEGPHVDALNHQIGTLGTHPDVAKGSYELAQLRIPALHVSAIWLKDKGGKSDIIVPVASGDPAIVAGQHYGMTDFLAALRPAANAAAANVDPLKGG